MDTTKDTPRKTTKTKPPNGATRPVCEGCGSSVARVFEGDLVCAGCAAATDPSRRLSPAAFIERAKIITNAPRLWPEPRSEADIRNPPADVPPFPTPKIY